MGFPNWSRAVTVMVDWLVPFDATIGDVALTVDCAAETELAVMLNADDVAPVSPPLDAARVYPASARSIDRPANVATPLTAATVPPPVSVPRRGWPGSRAQRRSSPPSRGC